MKHGSRITYKGEADEAYNTIPGDVVVVLQMNPHSIFRREGNHLFIKHRLTLLEALTGFSFNITHLDGRVIKMNSEVGSVVKPGNVKVVREEGMPNQSNPYQRGNLYIEIDVDFPKNGELDANAIRSLSAVLPRPQKIEIKSSVPPPLVDGTPGNQPMTDHPNLQPHYQMTLETVNNLAEEKRLHDLQQARENEREGHEEDDDEPQARGGGRPGCQQQ